MRDKNIFFAFFPAQLLFPCALHRLGFYPGKHINKECLVISLIVALFLEQDTGGGHIRSETLFKLYAAY